MMNKEGLTPVVKVKWTDLYKPDDHDFYGIVCGFDPENNKVHKKWLNDVRELCKAELTDPEPKNPWWKSKNGYIGVRFSSKYQPDKYLDAEDQPIDPPRRIDIDTEVQIKYKLVANNNGKYLNCYLNEIKIVRIPNKAEEPTVPADYEDDDVPF